MENKAVHLVRQSPKVLINFIFGFVFLVFTVWGGYYVIRRWLRKRRARIALKMREQAAGTVHPRPTAEHVFAEQKRLALSRRNYECC